MPSPRSIATTSRGDGIEEVGDRSQALVGARGLGGQECRPGGMRLSESFAPRMRRDHAPSPDRVRHFVPLRGSVPGRGPDVTSVLSVVRHAARESDNNSKGTHTVRVQIVNDAPVRADTDREMP